MSDHDIRLATIREICDREGHGQLIDVTAYVDGLYRRFICNRGCSTEILELVEPMTASQIGEVLERHGTNGIVRFRGRLEVRT